MSKNLTKFFLLFLVVIFSAFLVQKSLGQSRFSKLRSIDVFSARSPIHVFKYPKETENMRNISGRKTIASAKDLIEADARNRGGYRKPRPTRTPTPTPTPAPTAGPTATPGPTSTPAPTPTSAPIATPTTAPTATPTPTPGTIGNPVGLSPQQIKAAYNLPSTGGANTIAIVDAYDYPTAENDLNVFSYQFGLPLCTSANGCFEKHSMVGNLGSNSGWALEESLDIEWAHAIAPNAKILLVEAASANGNDLLNAVNYARNRADVVAVSMSWGGAEFSGESSYDSYFTSPYGAAFFASSGDSGTGVQWPAVSANVVGVGGTTLKMSGNTVVSETAWSGSGGGLSKYESEPSFQSAYGIPSPNGFRGVPDVSYDADPSTGVPVYDSTPYSGQSGWFQLGGTSVGSPQWAAIRSLGTNVFDGKFYSDAKTSTSYFRDIVSGSNGSCVTYCTALVGYDYVTGLGSPLTVNY